MNPKTLRIGLVGPLPPPSGGMANQTLQLAKLLGEEGVKVEVIQVNRPYSPAWVENLRGVRAVFRLVPYLTRLFTSARDVDLYHVMANSGWSWHLFAAPAIWIAALRGKPVVVNYRGGEADAFLQKSLSWVKASMMRADVLIVPSGFLKAVFGKYGIPAEVVPNIINLDRFSSTGTARRREDTPCLLVARNLEPIYDNATAIRAAAIVRETVPGLRLVVAGSGPERPMLEALARELGIADAVTFTGRVDNADMAALYRGADIMLNPSLVDNMPNSVLEALASGVPVISTNVGGVPYIVEHGKTALLVPPKSPGEMAAAIASLLADPSLAGRLRDAGIESVQQYTWANVRERLLRTYEQVLAKRTNAVLEQT
ncbi:glycosyltransferase family 4 protein [Noviherbaspirillum denitrificans]|uniref:Glycosyl transferase family 1 n=1 Tax=Noviherbaspirillum denitrificans TaxID=1968433 RepID=A0A254TNN5_9BURK|nr:glycosyltransferase family 4 protein [Noviherbaspirillum denitrificans]OWW22233.1 glycosyl transferase family 1 [Noviherbaspirillum denitrificans]